MFPDEALKNIWSVLLGLTPLGNLPPKMRLAQIVPSLTDQNMTLAALQGFGVEADYPGYTYQTVTFGAPAITAPDDGLCTSVTMTFQPVGLVTPEVIHGYWLTMWNPVTSTELLLMWVRLATPVILSSDASQFQRVINLYDANFTPP